MSNTTKIDLFTDGFRLDLIKEAIAQLKEEAHDNGPLHCSSFDALYEIEELLNGALERSRCSPPFIP